MKRGFTLVELIVVIVILGLLALVAYPTVINIINSSKEDAYNAQVLTIEKAAKQWGLEHTQDLPDSGTKKVELETLISGGYISSDEIKDPRNSGTKLNGCIEISYKSNQYEYKYNDNLKDC